MLECYRLHDLSVTARFGKCAYSLYMTGHKNPIAGKYRSAATACRCDCFVFPMFSICWCLLLDDVGRSHAGRQTVALDTGTRLPDAKQANSLAVLPKKRGRA